MQVIQDYCLGRSRGRHATKNHAVVDAQGPPIGLGLSAGQAHDGQRDGTLLDNLTPCAIVLADKAYDADRIRELVQEQGATSNMSIGTGLGLFVTFNAGRPCTRMENR
jgi:hypothetical protein